MPVSGAQDFWVVGARAYFKKTGLEPWRDLGIIQTLTPNITTESIELEDPDGGVKTTADKKVTKVTENYDLTCSNLNVRNLSLMFLGSDPVDVSIGAAEVSHASTLSYVGELFQIIDAASEPVRMTEIAGVYTGTVQTLSGDITAIDVSTKTLTVTTDPALWTVAASPGDAIIIHPDGLADPTHAGSYTIASTSTTTVVLVETLGGTADETAITTDITVGNTGTVYELGVDWAIVNEDRGLFKWIESGGAMVADATAVTVVYWQYAISGERKFLPQAVDTIEGELRLILSRDTFAREDERYIPKVKIIPGSANFQIDDYSNFVLNCEVVADDTKTDSVGHLINYKGAVPTKS